MSTVQVGDIIGARYRIDAVIGQGGMAVVYRATHTQTDRVCALKLILPHLAVRAGVAKLFAKEARVGGKIGSHSHIVDVLDAGIDERTGLPFLAMELLQGETLQQHLERGPVERELLRELVEQLAEALEVAHEAKVVHRDLKPSNLFVTRDRKGRVQLKVLDFGIAKVLEGDIQSTATEIGTPAYAAPEQMGPSFRAIAKRQGVEVADQVSPATDIWALGLIVYEALTGYGPGQYWSATTATDLPLQMALALRNAPSASERAEERAGLLPEGFDEWFGRCTRMDARERWGDAQLAWEALNALFEATGGKRRPSKRPPKGPIAQTSLGGMVDTFTPGSKGTAARTAPVQEAREVAPVPGVASTQLAGVVATMVGSDGAPVEDSESNGTAAKKAAGYKWLAIPAGLLLVAGVVAAAVSSAKKPSGEASSAATVSAPGASGVPNAGVKPQDAVLPPPTCPAGMVAIAGGTFKFNDKADVTLDGYCMDETEVTVDAYKGCVDAIMCMKPDMGEGCNWGKTAKGTHPVNCVDWVRSKMYCEWSNKKLPTEAQWEYAARGGAKQLEYPWGSEAPSKSNACGNSMKGTCPVGSYPAGAYGLKDMAGNVWEWTADWYGDIPSSPGKNYAGPSDGSRRVRRGGSWLNDIPSNLRGANRFNGTPTYRNSNLGLRCVRTK